MDSQRDAPTRSESVLFVDCDRFYFSVEAAERPGLAADQRPIIISHDPRTSPRAVVTTANDAARARGINSGMGSAQALRLAAEAIFLPPRHHIYGEYSDRVMAILRSASPLVQQNSVDEAALLWSGYERTPAIALRERVLAETGISISMGLASSPLVAKMASEAAKRDPDHLHVVIPGEEASFLAPLDVRALIGVGPKAEARLRALGIGTIGELAAVPLVELVGAFGKAYGRYLHEAARGVDDSELESERATKSISDEHTFDVDTRDRRVLWDMLRRQAASVGQRLKTEGLLALEIGIKLRYADWETRTRQQRLAVPTDEPAVLAETAAALMRRNWDASRPVRLIGLRAGRLVAAPTLRQLPLPGVEA